MKGARHRRASSARSLTGARDGLFRAALLFGSIAGALMLIVVPDADHRGRQMAADKDVDPTVTGSIATAGLGASARMARAAGALDAGPCIMFPDGSQKGTCR